MQSNGHFEVSSTQMIVGLRATMKSRAEGIHSSRAYYHHTTIKKGVGPEFLRNKANFYSQRLHPCESMSIRGLARPECNPTITP
jgi:hypothetical protein